MEGRRTEARADRAPAPLPAPPLSPQECQALRNFSSLYAIVSALQSMPIYRLNKTWGKVSRWGGLSTGGPGGGGSSHVSAIALSSAGASWVAVSPGHRAWVGVQCP